MMIPNDLLQRITRMDRQLQSEEQTDQVKLARKGLDQAFFWIAEEKNRRVQQKQRDLEERLAQQEGTTHP